MKRPGLVRFAAAITSGLLLASAYAPLDWYGAAWFGLIPLVAVLRFSNTRQGFGLGFLTGAVFWGLSMSWLLTLGKTGAPWALAIIGWLFLVLYCSLYFGMFAAVCAGWLSRWGIDDWRKNVAFTIVLPLIWAGFEYLRSILFTGFTWNTLGVSQYLNPLVCQMAELGGVYIVSAFLVTMNVALFLTAVKFGGVRVVGRYRTHPELTVALLAVAVMMVTGSRELMEQRDSVDPLEIAALQPNVPQTKKWPVEWAWMVVDKLERVSQMAAGPHVDLVVWPETAMPSYALTDPVCRQLVDDLLTNGVPMLIGSMDERMGEDYAPLYYNSAMLFEEPGEIPAIYDKCHLVPFGEYIPFTGIMPWLERLAPLRWSCADGDELQVFNIASRPDAKFSSLICFEDALPYLARNCVRMGARLIINQTNDAWFDDSAGLRQHMAHCVFRCIENRVPAIRVTNTGITCLIDRRGRIVRNSIESRFVDSEGRIYPDPLDGMLKEGFLMASVLMPPADMETTFYTKHGDVFAISCAVLAMAAFVLVLLPIVKLKSSRSGTEEKDPDNDT